MKQLILLNPASPRRRYKSIKMKTNRIRRSRSSRRVRRNPPKTSAATRAKISRAVKASFRRRRASGGLRKASRSPVRAVARRRSRRRSVVRAFSASPARRRSVRRSIRRRSSGGGGSGGSIVKQLMGRQVLSLAGGAIGASFATTFLLTKFGAKLPMANTQHGRLLYKIAIPAAGAFLVRKHNRDVATGMLVGGIIMVANDLIASMAGGTAALKEYADDGDGEEYSYYSGEADMASQTYMEDSDEESLGEGEISGDDGELGEYFEGSSDFNTDPIYSSATAFQTGFN